MKHEALKRRLLNPAISAAGDVQWDIQILIPPCMSGSPGMLDKMSGRNDH